MVPRRELNAESDSVALASERPHTKREQSKCLSTSSCIPTESIVEEVDDARKKIKGLHVRDESTTVCQGRGGEDTSQKTEDDNGCRVLAKRTTNLEARIDNECSQENRSSSKLENRSQSAR